MKNLLGFCFSLFNNKYADREGYRAAYVTYGEFKYLSVFCYPTLHIWQKLRRWTDEKEFMRSLYHEDNVPPSVAPSKTRLSEEFLHSDTTTNENTITK